METNEAIDFEKFLIANCNLTIESKSWFRRTNQTLFLPMQDQSKTLILPHELAANPAPPVKEALEEAKCRFGELPSGYCTFMSVLGPGAWAKAIVRHPHYLCPEFYEPLPRFVSVADNVDDQGGCVLFDPQDGTSNQRLYYACNDPNGYARWAESFEDWIRALTSAWIKDPALGYSSLYGNLDLIEFSNT